MSKVTVYFKKLVPEASAPVRAHEGDAGWDVSAVDHEHLGKMDAVTFPHNSYLVHTGIAVAVPKGYWIDLRARSSVYKKGLILANGCGVIDSSYRGEVMAVFYRVMDGTPYSINDRIAQLVVQPALTTDVEFVEVDELPPSEDGRGEGGFGSTGE